MCEICNVERGDCEILVNKEVEVKVGRMTLTPHLLSLYIDNNDEGYSICCEYWIDNSEAVARIKMPIEYCPFCGRKLSDRKKKDYPWTTEEEP